jgi:protein-S-isoprenylcysteine O-methyltransferase Ste14
MFFGMALALRSWWALLPAALATNLLVVRTKWEDDLLKRELPGYTAYAQTVRARLVPGLW